MSKKRNRERAERFLADKISQIARGGLTKDNYFSREAQEAYFSASFVKEMASCPARAIAQMRGEWQRPPSKDMLIGSYVDAYFEGTMDTFKAQHPKIFNSRTGALKSEFVKANAMIERAQQSGFFMSFLSGRKQHIQTGNIGGYLFRCKMDFFLPGVRIVDLKTTKDMQPQYKRGEGLISFAEFWRYPLQMAIYQRLEGHNLPVYLAVITKQDPPDLAVIQIPQYLLDAEITALEAVLPYYDAMRQGVVEPERCENCAYCRATKKLKEVQTLDDFLEV